MTDQRSGFGSILQALTAILALFITGQVAAVSIYDVIELSRQDFSDEQIVRIIRSTGSAFELEAEDIPRLKKLGVSEVIIQTMLKTTPVETPSGHSLDEEERRTAPVLDTARPSGLEVTKPATREKAGLPAVPAGRFAFTMVAEEEAGGHRHAYVTMNGLPVLVLRDEGHYQSIAGRAGSVVDALEESTGAGSGRFKVRHDQGAEVVVYEGDLRQIPVIRINRRDVQAYDVRSERRLNTELLAAYWAALLNDYWAIAVSRVAPSHLVDLHRGDALTLLFEVVSQSERSDLRAAVLQLPGTIRRHLERLARAVPDDFEAPEEHSEET